MGAEAGVVKEVDVALALGFPLPQALANALRSTLAQVAGAEGWRAQEMTMMLGGYRGRVYGSRRDRLAELVGGTREDVDRWIEQEARRRTTRSPAAA